MDISVGNHHSLPPTQDESDEKAITHKPEKRWATKDPQYGHITLPYLMKHFIDSPLFQRMRNIKQTGITHYVYEGCTHTRSEHCVGVCHLAWTWMTTSLQKQAHVLGKRCTDKDVLCICLAGLLHDLGHPAFSHGFESVWINLRKALQESSKRKLDLQATFDHEDASELLWYVLFEEKWPVLKEAGFEEDDKVETSPGVWEQREKVFIKELINPPKKKLVAALEKGTLYEEWPKLMQGRGFEESWMYEIISNWRSGIDVDRMDYFRRDASHFGVVQEFETDRFFDKAILTFYNPDRNKLDQLPKPDKRSVWTIAVPSSEVENMQRCYFEVRKKLHEKGYQHITVKKVELHMQDFTVAADVRVNKFDHVAYSQITDDAITSKLTVLSEDSKIRDIQLRFQYHIAERHLMKRCYEHDIQIVEIRDKETNCRKLQREWSDEDIPKLKDHIVTRARNSIQSKHGDAICTPQIDELYVMVRKLDQGGKNENPMKNLVIVNKEALHPTWDGKYLGSHLEEEIINQNITDEHDEIRKLERKRMLTLHYQRLQVVIFYNAPIKVDTKTNTAYPKYHNVEAGPARLTDDVVAEINAACKSYFEEDNAKRALNRDRDNSRGRSSESIASTRGSFDSECGPSRLNTLASSASSNKSGQHVANGTTTSGAPATTMVSASSNNSDKRNSSLLQTPVDNSKRQKRQ